MSPAPRQPSADVLAIACERWTIIDDAVMGGVSRGRADLEQAGVHFHGLLSTDYGGGFSSMRTPLDPPLEARRLAAFRLDVQGDGRRYQLRLRDREESSAPAWRASFGTSGRRETVELRLADFEPVVRGRRVEVLPPLADRVIRHLGLMLVSDRPGPFSLRVFRIEALQGEPNHG